MKGQLKKEDIKDKLEVCFKKCAAGRNQLRKYVDSAMDKGITKEEILTISNKLKEEGFKDEASLCAITAIGQALKYEGENKKTKPERLTSQKKDEIYNKLKQCFKKCGLARRQLRKCVASALNSGLTKEELLAICDDLVGGFGKDQVSVCAIIAVDEVLKYEDFDKLKKMVKMYAPYMEFPE